MRDHRAQYHKDLAAGKKDLFDISSGKDLAILLLMAGGIIALMQFAPYLLAAAMPLSRMWKDTPDNRRKFTKTFSRLKNNGHIEVESRRGHVEIRLTTKGRRFAQRGYARALLIKPRAEKAWDKKWRLILFDVPTADRLKRNAFRTLIRRLGATMLQKSVWVYPYDCADEIGLLQDFFELDDSQVRLVISESIGDDRVLRRYFKI